MASESSLTAERLYNDPRVAQAKELLLAAVADHQKELAEVRGPNPALAADYKVLLDQFGKHRGGNTFFPYLGSGIGNGSYVEIADGSVKLDMITGIGVHGYGHSHPLIVEAGIDAAISDTVMQGNLQQNTNSCDLSKLLVDTACETGAELKHCFLTTSGAMANENSLKMAFQQNHPANRVIAFSHCFAGRTLALAQVTDKAKYRVGLPDTIDVDYLPFFDQNDPQRSTQVAVNQLQDHIDRHPGKHAALWMELVQGEGGYYPGDHKFFEALIEVARENNIAVIADEVQTFSRTTRAFAFQHFGLDKLVDIVTIGKFSQLCATLFTDQYAPKPGLISQTFTGSTGAIFAGHAMLKGLIDNGHFGDNGKNVQLHNHFVKGLKRVAEKHPNSISGPHGIGGMVALTPFDGSAEVATNMVKRMYDHGLMSFMAGGNPSRVRFLMPLGCVTEQDIDTACDIIEAVVAEMA